MKHLIIVKFKENVWVRESEASRKMLADIREIFDQTQQIEGVHTVNIYGDGSGGAACIRCFRSSSGMEGKIRGRYSVQDYL